MDNQIYIGEEEWNEIDAFLAGRLDEEARKAVQERIDSDPEYQKKLATVRELSLGIEEAGLTQHLKTLHQRAFSESARGKVVSSRFGGLKTWVAAASLLVLVASGIFYLTGRQSVFNEFYRPDEGLPTYMGATDNYIFDKAMVDYKTGEFESAIKGWSQLLVQNTDNDTLNYFIGSAWLAKKNPVKAISFFDRVIVFPQSVFLQEARWYKALALIKEGNKDEAVALLRETEHEGKAALLKKLE